MSASNGYKLATYVAIFASALIQVWLILRLIDGDILNSYPFISNDGYDYIYEGAYLKIILTEGVSALPPLYVLRNPVFVLISLGDSIFGQHGIVFTLTLALSFLASCYFLALILRELRVDWSIILWAVLIYIFTPLAYFRFWILADLTAVAFMHASAFFLLRYSREGRRVDLICSTAMMLLGGWTQAYGVIPFFVGMGLIVVRNVVRRQKVATPLVAILIGGVLFVSGSVFWKLAIEHENVPAQFGLLGLSTKMFVFYANAWSFYWGPLLFSVGYFLLSLRYRVPRLDGPIVIIATIVLVFCCLVVLYQWADSRFTFIFFGFVLVLAAAMLSTGEGGGPVLRYGRPIAAFASLIALIATSLLVIPLSYWTPALGSARIAPRQTWLLDLIAQQPADRFNLKAACRSTSVFCDAAPFLEPGERYPGRILADYRALMLKKAKAQQSR